MCKIIFRGVHPPVLTRDTLEGHKDHFQPGDFVHAVPDNHQFGKEEKPPLFHIVSVPDMTIEEALLLCRQGKHVKDHTDTIIKYAARSAFSVDLNAIGDTISRQKLLEIIKLNGFVDNPEIIGSHSNEIG